MNGQTEDVVTRTFIGLAMQVHTSIGPGLREEIYHQELIKRLTLAGIEYESKPRRELSYRDIVVDTLEPDLVVEKHFIPELKSLRSEFAGEHWAQLLSYCKFWRLRTGMLVNFGRHSLQWKRVIYESKTAILPSLRIDAATRDYCLAMLIHRSADECLRTIGLGYRETTWQGLIAAALQSSGLHVLRRPSVLVNGITVPMDCLVVEDRCVVFVIALRDNLSASDRAILQTYLRWLGFPWGIIFHFGKSTADCRFVSAPTSHVCEIPSLYWLSRP